MPKATPQQVGEALRFLAKNGSHRLYAREAALLILAAEMVDPSPPPAIQWMKRDGGGLNGYVGSPRRFVIFGSGSIVGVDLICDLCHSKLPLEDRLEVRPISQHRDRREAKAAAEKHWKECHATET